MTSIIKQLGTAALCGTVAMASVLFSGCKKDHADKPQADGVDEPIKSITLSTESGQVVLRTGITDDYFKRSSLGKVFLSFGDVYTPPFTVLRSYDGSAANSKQFTFSVADHTALGIYNFVDNGESVTQYDQAIKTLVSDSATTFILNSETAMDTAAARTYAETWFGNLNRTRFQNSRY